MSNFWARTITGLSMVFLLLLALYFSGWVFAGIFLVVTMLGLWEFYGLIAGESCHPQKLWGTIAGMLIFASTAIAFMHPFSDAVTDSFLMTSFPFFLTVILIFITFILEIYRNKSNPLVNISTTVLGLLYIALPFSLLLYFVAPGRLHFQGMPVVLTSYFAFTWIYDTAAYLYGKQFGKHKMFERISPKKTWEGTIAGVIVTLILATVLQYMIPEMPLIDWLALATIVIVFGTHGDLVESLFKRSLNIKDSGTILPGHGGILDRFDTMLISAPFVFLYFFLLQSI
jgi:phosphatidate cytidylyltransferase